MNALSNEIDRDSVVRKMAELLRGGATLLADTCPLCNSPLLKLPSGDIVCPVHGRVFIARTEEEVAEAGVVGTLTELEKSIVMALSKLINSIRRGDTSGDIARDVILWLDALERIERIRSAIAARKALQSQKTQERR